MKKQPRKLLCIATAMCLGLILAATPAYADTGDSTLQVTAQPAKLILQLGPGWAGTQFELRTDAGMYPEPVVVSENGLLQMDLGGSKTYTLSRVQTASPGGTTATAAVNAPVIESTIPDGSTTALTTDVDLDDFLAGLTEPGTEGSAEQPEQEGDPSAQGNPTKYILILGGGIIAAAVALVILTSLKKHRDEAYEEDDYDDF